MISLFWNIRGVAKAPSRLALKRLIKLHKPDFVFIDEPKMRRIFSLLFFSPYNSCGVHYLIDIIFWFDNWCGTPLYLDYPSYNLNDKLMVNHFIDHNTWDLSSCPVLDSVKVRIINMHIPFDIRPDKRIWKHDSSSELTLKLAYYFKRATGVPVEWRQFIWSKHIPPSKSFIAWRLLLRKFPSDEQLKILNFSLPSKCSLCGNAGESDHHLFFYCSYAASLWSWLLVAFQNNSSITCWNDIWRLSNICCSKISLLVFKVVTIFIINAIWMAHNSSRFKEKFITVSSSKVYILSTCSLAGEHSSVLCHIRMSDFVLLKFFKIRIKPPNAPKIVEVILKPPPQN
ncbi:unnamed protein product [Vicia faba]|uniref:Reverse transcriptase zinc-binding domain-containing protein n=1 Tax=Vicia faba TaxID=3906 RepID=A0AAV0ZQQ3_VICFA|nr:unnamed protein product [Vicia faba]